MVLETERLIIRSFRADDWKDLHAYLSLSETYAFEPGSPVDEEGAKRLAKERSGSGDFLAVELKSSRAMIGHLYFARQEPAEFATWELGYIFNPSHQRKGYCTEASRRILGYGFRELGAHRVVAYCDPLNPASWKVLDRIGMRLEGYFPRKAFFRKDSVGRPLWHDCYAYGALESSFAES